MLFSTTVNPLDTMLHVDVDNVRYRALPWAGKANDKVGDSRIGASW